MRELCIDSSFGGHQIIVTEDPNEHLIWHETRVFVEPLLIFLLNLNG
jgi:hypothetical protein